MIQAGHEHRLAEDPLRRGHILDQLHEFVKPQPPNPSSKIRDALSSTACARRPKSVRSPDFTISP